MRATIRDYMEMLKKNDLLPEENVYVGIKTMNIYCLPSCTGRPKPENIVIFASRREAEQMGYRPCKTCFSALPPGRWKDHGTHIMLQPPDEFRFAPNLAYLTRSSNECLYHVEDGVLTRLLQVDHEAILVEISSPDDKAIRVGFPQRVPHKKSVRVAAASYVWDWFDLDQDIKPFYLLAGEDPLLGNVIKEYEGLRILGISDLFEALSWSIIGQQINLTFAYTLKRRFVETFGRGIEWEGKKYWLFPRAEDAADLTVDALRLLQFTTKKAEYIIGVAQLIKNGLSKQQLLRLGDSRTMEKELVKIRGIGPWSANYTTMRCLRQPSAFPLDDVGLHNAIKHLLQMERKPTRDEVLKLSEPWGEWKGYATFYLWMTLYSDVSP